MKTYHNWVSYYFIAAFAVFFGWCGLTLVGEVNARKEVLRFCPRKDVTAYELSLLIYHADTNIYPQLRRHICNDADNKLDY